MKKKLVGFKKFTSKKNGQNYCIMYVVGDFSPREIDSGCTGQKSEEIFAPMDFVDIVNPSHIGKEIELEYDLSNGRAYLVGVRFADK